MHNQNDELDRGSNPFGNWPHALMIHNVIEGLLSLQTPVRGKSSLVFPSIKKNIDVQLILKHSQVLGNETRFLEKN